ncbi:LysR family transcriptional regulator [Castellaniella sp. S9]|uniref:LysR family transcriptional regulator n=1 Tax=Castellaniella sp. S9 TaxID=2993652 RepID=UPI0022B4982C|nr:LysR family transcriptional regulator [Castellaniella sp. S9]
MATRRGNEALDTYLIKVFCILMAERSVSRTALKLNQSQPAISVALKNLRAIFHDPLLVRDKGGMVPTDRALAILEHAKAALGAIDSMLESDEDFDPAQSRQVFRIGSPDYLAPVFAATVVGRFRREAPHARLMLHALGPDFDFEQSLAEGSLDVVIGNWPEPPDRMHLSVLLEDEIVCLMSADHPMAGRPMALEDYCQARHVVPTPYSIRQRGMIDTVLTSLRVERDQVVEAQSFMLAPYLLPGTDLVFTTTRHFARYYAGLLPLAIVDSPIDFPPMRFYQLWHPRNHHAPSHQWLRRLLADCGRSIYPDRQPAGLGAPPAGA